MKAPGFGLILAAALASVMAVAAPTDEETAARKIAVDLGATFPAAGFKMREGQWCGPLSQDEASLIQVHLYAGNEYRFLVGATAPAKSLGVGLYDEGGRPVAAQPASDGNASALSFAPDASGPYYLRIEELEGDPATFCLIYYYK